MAPTEDKLTEAAAYDGRRLPGRNRQMLSAEEPEGLKIRPANADRDDHRTVMLGADSAVFQKVFSMRSGAQSVRRKRHFQVGDATVRP